MGPEDIALGEDVTPLAVSRTGQAGVVLSVRVPSSLVGALEMLAVQDGRYLSALARDALAEYVQRRMSNVAPSTAPQTSNRTIPWVHPR